MDVYQGKTGTVSPAFGNYDLQIYLDVDKQTAGVTGIGETGTGSLALVDWAQGVTGMSTTNTNIRRGF